MNKFFAFLYRLRGYILGLFALGVLLCPAYPLIEQETPAQFFCLCLVFVFYTLGVFLRVNARMYIGAHSRGKKHEASELETSGIYAYMRHPLYVSNTLIIMGALVLHLGFTPLMFIWACVGCCFEFLLAKIEDRFLASRFGEEWRKWALQTKILPSFFDLFGNVGKSKRAEARKIPPKRTFMQAFCADWSSWVWLLFFNFLILIQKFI